MREGGKWEVGSGKLPSIAGSALDGASHFPLPTSHFQLPTSNFQLPTKIKYNG